MIADYDDADDYNDDADEAMIIIFKHFIYVFPFRFPVTVIFQRLCEIAIMSRETLPRFITILFTLEQRLTYARTCFIFSMLKFSFVVNIVYFKCNQGVVIGLLI